jgi:hypothetical protein
MRIDKPNKIHECTSAWFFPSATLTAEKSPAESDRKTLYGDSGAPSPALERPKRLELES